MLRALLIISLLCCSVLGLAVPSSAGAADRFLWSGTVTMTRAVSGDVLHGIGDDGDFSYASTITGQVEQAEDAPFPLYRATVTSYSDVSSTGFCESSNTLRGTDEPDAVSAWVEWGRPTGDGGAYVPRFYTHESASLEFPSHTFACLAYDNGELNRYESTGYTPVHFSSTVACLENQGSPPGDLPIAAPYTLLPPPLPARRDLGDGRIAFTGTTTSTCTYTSVGARSDVLTMTYDLVGTPDTYVAPLEELQVVTHGTQYGSLIGGGGAISCGLGASACTTRLARGTAVRLGTQLGAAGTFHFWVGCDEATGSTCLLTLNSPRTVHGYFGYDFIGQWEPPPSGLFSLDRKAEIAGNGASAASDGAVGCGLTAGLIGGGIAGGGLAVSGATVATRETAFLEKLIGESVGNCAQGVAGTMYNGLLLKIDPPDPQWRRIALAEPYPVAKLAPCALARRCANVTRARTGLAAANRRVIELQEALAVASNRYGNAANAKDKPVQALHQATMRATSGLLAEATAKRNRAAVVLVAELRRAGIRRIVVPRAAVARAVAAQRGGRGVPKGVVARLLRRKLIASASEVPAAVRANAPRRIAAYDAMRALGRPVSTKQMQVAADALTLGDVVRLVDAVLRDTKLDPVLAELLTLQLESALRCDDASPQALRDLAAAAGGARGVTVSEGRLLIALAAREVATHPLQRDEACGGPA